MVVTNPGSSEVVSRPEETLLTPPSPSEKTVPPSPPSSPSSSSTSAQSSSSSTSTSDQPIPNTSANIAIVISPPIPLSSPPSFNDAIAISPGILTQGVDDDVVQYNLAHGRGDAGGVRRPPESFPNAYEPSLVSSLGPPESLPAYGANEPPRYTRYEHNPAEEPQVFARILFKMGFLFPVFWFCGALMLITPLHSSNPLNQASGRRWSSNTSFAAWCNEHLETEEEKAEFITKIQAAERKWAKRCLLASFIVVCFGIAFGAMIYAVLKSTSPKSLASDEQSSATWTP